MLKSGPTVFLTNWHQTGGAELNAIMLGEGYIQRGEDALVAFYRFRSDIQQPRVPTTLLVPRNTPWWLRHASVVRSLFHLSRMKPKAVIGFQNGSNVLGALLALIVPNCRFIATQRNPAKTGGALATAIDKYLGCTPVYERIVCVSEAVKESFSSYPRAYRNKLTVIYNGLPPLAETDLQKEQARIQLGLDPSKPVIGALGRLASQKNLMFLLQVLESAPDYDLILAGSGQEQPLLQAEAVRRKLQARVKFLGDLSREEVPVFFRALNVCVIPSLFEGFCRTLVEAMFSGVPTLTSQLDVFAEIGGEAIVRLPFEPDMWAEAIRRIDSDSSFAQCLSRKARQRAEQFSRDSMIAGYLQLTRQT